MRTTPSEKEIRIRSIGNGGYRNVGGSVQTQVSVLREERKVTGATLGRVVYLIQETALVFISGPGPTGREKGQRTGAATLFSTGFERDLARLKAGIGQDAS
jgi:hypothetical protein